MRPLPLPDGQRPRQQDALGLSLSAEQVAALTHDIVWLEEHEVNGEKVLVPVLYLAQAEGRLAANGALIQGRDVTLISGGELLNQGTLRASENLTATAGNINNSGLIEAGERLQLLATDSIRNAQGGIIAGRDVSLTALTGDVINERSVTRHEVNFGKRHEVQDFVDSAARIEAANSLSIVAGRDVANRGAVLASGGDLSINAGRDVTFASVEERVSQARGKSYLNERVTQFGAQASAGRDLEISAGRDLSAIASQLDARRELAMEAGGDVLMASAANESHFLSKSKKVIRQTDHVDQQATTLSAGGDVYVGAEGNLILSASKIAAGDEAYLVAGENLALLSAEDYDYSLYQKKSKGSFGRKSFKRNESTQVTQVGSEITTGGDLTLVSDDDQLYQRASLDSGNDLTLVSGGEITFEGVKDLKQESREKSKSSFTWQSAKGKGKTDETLQQSQLSAQGEIVIQAVEGLNIDLKQVNRQTVSQTIGAMAKADPNLAWLKEMEQRGDVDWRRVKEVHDSFKYSSSGLGAGAQLVIAIAIAAYAGPMISNFIGAGTSAGSAFAAAVPATATSPAIAAGWANVALTAAATGATSNAAVSVINNRGDLGAVLKDVTSSDNLKGYATSALTAGFTTGVLDGAFGVTGDNVNKVTKGFDLSKTSDLVNFGSYLGAQGAVQAVAQTAVQGGSLGDNLRNALTKQVQHLLQAVAFNAAGDLALGNTWEEGSPEKITLHALVGGLLSEATGGDFKTGALAAGVNEALLKQLTNVIDGDRSLELAVSQLVGVAAATATGGDPAKAAELAKNATAYNRQLHEREEKWLRENAKRFADDQGISEQEALERLSQQALKDVDYLWRGLLSDGDDNIAKSFLADSGQTFTNDLGGQQALFTASGHQLFRPEMFADTADTQFYRDFVQSGISRELSAGVLKELKDSGVSLKNDAVELGKLIVNEPGMVLDGLWEGIKGLPQGVVDSLHESGNAIGEGSATALNEDISSKLNAIYGMDVSTAQETMLLVRTVTAVVSAGTVGAAGKATANLSGELADAVGKKLDNVLNGLAEQALVKSGGIHGADGKPLLDLKQLTNKQKGVMGELFGENTVKQIISDGEKLARMPGVGETGIDDLYKVNRPDVDYVVIEYKFVGTDSKTGASVLGKPNDGVQGSESWTLGSGRLEKAVEDRALAADIADSIQSGRTETWVVTTRVDGATELQILDGLGKPKPIDTSKILTSKMSLSGSQP